MQTDRERRPQTLAHLVSHDDEATDVAVRALGLTRLPRWAPRVSNGPLRLHFPPPALNNQGRWPVQNSQVTPCTDLNLIHPPNPHTSAIPNTQHNA